MSMSRLMSRPLRKSMPFKGSRWGMGQKGRQRVSCVSRMKDMVPTVKRCIICHVKWWANQAARKPLPSMAVSSTMCRTGKKTAKSRRGVIHNWMFDMHSKVPCILAMPAMKQTTSRRGIDVECIVMRLHTPMTMAAPQSNCWLVKRNFMRKSRGK